MVYPVHVKDSSHPVLDPNIDKGDQGDPAIYVIPNPGSIPIPSDSDGSNPVLTNAKTYLRVLYGGEQIADEANVNGFTATQSSITGGTITISGLTITIATITADVGYADIKISKAGYSDMYARFFFYKAKEGATGTQGIQGIQGVTGGIGTTGAAGVDGDGIVVLKHTIKFMTPFVGVTTVDYGGGVAQINTGTAHGYSVGERVEISNSASHDGEYIITDIDSASSFRAGITYVSVESCDVTNLSHLRKVSNNTTQAIHLNDFITARYKPLELTVFNTIMDKGVLSSEAFYIYAGDNYYPNAGYYKYMSAAYFYSLNDQISEDLTDESDFQQIDITDRDFYLCFYSYPGSGAWDDFVDLEFDVMIPSYNLS